MVLALSSLTSSVVGWVPLKRKRGSTATRPSSAASTKPESKAMRWLAMPLQRVNYMVRDKETEGQSRSRSYHSGYGIGLLAGAVSF